MEIKVKKLVESAIIPKLATSGAACFDLHAVKDALSGVETAAESPAGPSKVRNPRMWAVVKANGQSVSKADK